jgi:chorismate dehydratase
MKIVTVSYLNTLPFIQGLEKAGFDIVKAYPAQCAELLHAGKADIALIPVGALQENQEYYILSDYGIGADGFVRTVALFGSEPLEEWTELFLDYQSRTSVLLTRVLMKHYWKRDIPFTKGTKGYEELLTNNRGGLIIGDRAFTYEEKYPYQYDLSKAWKMWTGLPFIFAVWVSLKKIDSKKVEGFANSLEFGLQNFQISSAMTNLSIHMESYFKENISYRFSQDHWKAFEKFNGYTGRNNLKVHRL